METDELLKKRVDKTYTKIEAYKNEITIIVGVVTAIIGCGSFILDTILQIWYDINIDIEGLWALFTFSGACLGIGKFGRG